MAIRTVGFVGAGLMGHGMAKNILEKGFALQVLGNRNRAPIDDLVSRGAVEAGSIADLAGNCDLIVTCLPNSGVVEDVLIGPDGVVRNARPGLYVVDTTTADPVSTKKVAGILADAGVRMLDAPLTRTPREAEAGRLNTLVGGDAADLEAVRPVLETYSENIFHIGALGTGHSIKLINNFMSMTLAATTAEMITTARKAGVDLTMLKTMIDAGALNNGMFQMVMKYPLEGDPSGLMFALSNARKDVAYYENMVMSLGGTSPVGSGVLQAYAQAEAMGMGDEFVPKLIDALGRISGLEPLSKD